jgi:hypothetical protein
MGGILMVLGNPEQAVVVCAGLLVMSWSSTFRPWRVGAAATLVVSGSAFLLLTQWSNNVGIPSRTDYFGPFLRQSLSHFFMQLPLTLYVGFGLSALAVFWTLLDQDRRGLIATVVGCLAIPVVASAVTLDQTRVLVCSSIACMTAILVRYAEPLTLTLASGLRFPLACTALATLLLPALEVTGNVVRVPWGNLYPYVQSFLLG